jgi:ADP-heptose:LPS heptosyltransferase
MLHHLAHTVGKKGIVLFSQSDPKHFGYEENINLYKDKKFFRQNQFDIWEFANYNKDAFVEPEVILNVILKGNFI